MKQHFRDKVHKTCAITPTLLIYYLGFNSEIKPQLKKIEKKLEIITISFKDLFENKI